MNIFATLPDNILFVLALVYCTLFSAQLILWICQRVRSKSFIEMKNRIRSWWVMVFIFTIALVTSKNVSITFLGFVSFIALKEYFSMIPTRRADRRAIFWAYLTIPIQYYSAAIGYYGFFIVFIPVYMFLLIPARMIAIGETRHFLQAIGTIHWGLMTTVYCLSHAAFLLSIKPTHTLPAGHAGLLLCLIVLTQANDIAQFCWGKLIGKRKISPTVSPNKTVGGWLGGVITTAILALLISPLLTPFTHLQALVIGGLVGISGFIGDLNISAVKRDIGIKDTGSLLPGHGGILDRVDSLTFTAPIFFHYINFFYVP
jgi:phosphatidate cytidylyltransferase